MPGPGGWPPAGFEGPGDHNVKALEARVQELESKLKALEAKLEAKQSRS